MIQIKAIDAHAAGQLLRLVVDGFPSPPGATMAAKRDWLKRRADHLRRIVVLEPRGHRDLVAAILTEPVLPGSHAGIVCMDADGYGPPAADAVAAVTTIALERGLLQPGGDGTSIFYDTSAGTIRARATPGQLRVTSVHVVNVPSFVLHGGLLVALGSRHLRADVAFGGGFYAIVDGESAGLAADAAHLPELRRLGLEIAKAIDRPQSIVHPSEPDPHGIAGTIFTGPAESPAADLRSITVFASGAVDRSPCATGTAAVMAVIDAMGMLADDRPFVNEGLIGTTLPGRVTSRTLVGDHPAVITEVETSAWITAEHTFVVDDDDPLASGFGL